MKRFLLIAFASLCFLPVWALGNNSGETKANAIEFDWQNGNEQSEGTKWYRVDLAPLYDDLDAPTLMLHLTNLDETSTTSVTIKATLLGQTEERTYALAPKASQVWTKGAAMLVQTNTTEVFLTLKTDHKIAVSARAYETTNVDESCLGATLFSIEEDATFQQAAGTEKWYQADLNDLYANGAGEWSEAVVTIQNLGNATAVVEGGLSMDCPASGITEYTLSIPAGKSITRTINRAMIDAVKGKDVYVRIRNNQPINVSVAYQDANFTPIFESTNTNTIEVEADKWYSMPAGTTEQIYKIRMGAIRGNKLMPEVRAKNDGTSNANVTVQVGLTPNPTSVIERKGVLTAGEQRNKDIEKNLIDGIALDDDEYLYVRVLSDQPISGSLRMKHVNEGDVCKTSVDFDWENGHLQNANTTVWYAVDIKEAKESISDIILTVENLGGTSATMHGDIAFDCPYLDLQSITRTFSAGETKNKRIQYSIFGMLATDTVWVGLTTNQKARITAKTEKAETVTPDDACLTAVVFNMEEGHKQRAGESIWYKVGIKELRYVEELIYVSIQNRSTAPLTINGELSLECPDMIANTTASLQIAAEGNYEKQIARDLIDNIDAAYDTVYVKLTGTQDFSFRVYLEKEDIGSTCSVAIPFIWTSGHDQQANTALWYMVDLTTAKTQHSDVRLTITNKDNTSGAVAASFAFSCPSDVPQTERTYFQAQQTKTKTLPYTALETADDIVWVRVSSELGIHFEAELVTPEHFDTIECPENVKSFEWDKLYEENGGTDTAWYYLGKTILDDITNSGETPRLYLHNTAGTSNTITAKVAYHCPITSTMISKSITLGNNAKIWKMLERSFATQVAGRDTVMVQLIASGPYEFRASLVNPDDGADCLHAQVVHLPDTLVQEASTTMWYKLDVQAAADLRKKITFGIHNTDNTAGKVDAAVYFSCEEETIAARTITLGASGTVSKEVTSELFSGLNSKYIYLQLTTAQQVALFATVSALDTLIPNITACEQAIPVAPNTLYTQETDSAWYVVNIADLRDNTKGDGLLTVTNLSANTMTASAEISWECPVVYEMTKQTRSINTEYTRTLPRTTIEATKDSLLYVLVTTDNPLSFRLDIAYSKGATCDDAILFDWVNGNIHSSESPLWYRVELDENKVPEGKDLRLWIDNLDMTNPTDAGATLYFECDGQVLGDIDHTFDAGESKYSDIDRQLLQAVGWADLIILYYSNHNTKITVELVDHIERKDTSYVRICEGEPWQNPVTQEIMYFYRSWSDMAEVSHPLQWNDTVHVRGGSLNCDSIYTFYVTPLALPADITESTLIANNAIPVLKQGMEVFTDSSIVNIERYFLTVDSVALQSAQWNGIPTGKLAKNINELPLTLTLTDSCGDISRDYKFKFPVEPYRVDSVKKDTSICEGSEFVIRDKQITIWNDTIVRDTVPGVTVPDTLGLERQIDSVYVYDIKVSPILRENINATICEGDVYQFGGNDIHIAGTYHDTIPSLVTGCDSIVTLDLTVYPIKYDTITATICEGDTHLFGDEFIGTAGLHSDTLTSIETGCDSIVTLRLYVLTPMDTIITTETIPAGTSYPWHTWRDTMIYTAGTHYDTAHYSITGCDSVYYELRLTIADPITANIHIFDTVCVGTAYPSRTQSVTIYGDTIWDEKVLFHDTENGDIDSTYYYDIKVFRTTMPTIEESDIVAICGKAIDHSAADAFINDAIEAEPLYAPNATVAWKILDGDWKLLDESAIDGQTETVTLKYVIASDCGEKESEPIVVNVEQPTPANSEDMANLPAVNKYNSYLLMIHLNDIQTTYGWTISEEDVTWYQVAGNADPLYPDDNEKDTEVGKGYYYTTGEQLAGAYYALIRHAAADASDCPQSAMTEVITCTTAAAQTPALHPTVANPAQAIHVVNLDPAQQTEIRVYNTAGNLLDTYTTTDVKEFLLRAASQQGYYLVDVQSNRQKTTLRYIVK